MNHDVLLNPFQPLLDRARARGIKPPVLLSLAADFPRARAAYTQLHGQLAAAWPGPDPTSGPTTVDAVSVRDAYDVLLRHAGPGGAAVGDRVNDPTLGAEYWFVALSQDGIRFAGFRRGKTVLSGFFGYGRVRRPNARAPADEGPSHLNLRGPDGKLLQVCGRTGRDASHTGALLTVLARYGGTVTFADPRGGPPAVVRVTEDLVVSHLSTSAYRPDIVAEAVRALERVYPGKTNRVLSLLRRRADLEPLARAVDAVLTAEPV
jgi:hypothetical protein